VSVNDITGGMHYTMCDDDADRDDSVSKDPYIKCNSCNTGSGITGNEITDEEYAAKVQELALLGMKLGVPVPYATYSVDVIKDGNVIDHREGYSRSWNRNFYNWLISEVCFKTLNSTVFGAGYLSMKGTNGNMYSTGYIVRFYYYPGNIETSAGYYGPINNSTRGIVVGTGTGPEIFNDYALGTLIPSGTGSGQLSYQESRSPTKTWDSDSSQFIVSWKRYFNNNSGASITVNEMGIYGYFDESPYSYMVCRDKLSSGIELPDAAQLLVTYNIITQFPTDRS
jgi:hypothetical protein